MHTHVIDISMANPRYFEENDQAWIPIGCNICFDRKNVSDEDVRNNFERWLRRFAENGGNCIRLWAGASSLEVMPKTAGVFDAEKTKTMQFIIKLCEELNIKVKITLESFRMVYSEEQIEEMKKCPEVNIGYMCFFNRSLYAPYAKNMREFYQSAKCREIYLMKARYFQELGFGDSPAIYCWELWNEINATAPLEAYAEWSDTMLATLKAMFPRQLTVQNLGSFSDMAAYQAYDQLAVTTGNAFMQIHRYLDAGACLEICRAPMDVMAAASIKEILERRDDCPAILAETGAVLANHAGPFPYYAYDKEGVLLHDAIFAAFFAGSAGCGQFWHWDHQYIDGNNLWWQFGRFAKAVDGVDPVAENFHPFYTESRHLRMYGLRGQTFSLVWCRDKANDWKAEFIDANKPQLLTEERVPFNNCTLHCYLPWEDRNVEVQAPMLPPFKRSIVIKVPSEAVDGVVRPH